MDVWNFEKRAGLILDHQDDPGAGWQLKIAQFWPDGLDAPNFGVKADTGACLTKLASSNGGIISRYPADTPSNALSSAMYFEAFGAPSIQKEAHDVIREGLKVACLGHGVEVPDGFSKQASLTRREIFADDDGRLPVTTGDQTRDSIRVFTKYASRWPIDDRMVLGRKLACAARRHELGDDDVPYTRDALAKTAEKAVDTRIELVGGAKNHPDRIWYLDQMSRIKGRLSTMKDYEQLLKTAADLERADQKAGVDEVWDEYVPTPYDSLTKTANEPEVQVFKTAETDYSQVDWEELKQKIDPELVDDIAEDPNTIVPTLPRHERAIVEAHLEQ